jgi:hypothetical protein
MQAYCVKCRAKREMQGCSGHNYEEWETSNSGHMPGMRDQSVQNRQELGAVIRLNRGSGFIPTTLFPYR